MKNLGFNTLRKHIKVEPEEFYYQCDRLGMIVWQDMVNNGSYRYFRDTVLPTVGIQKPERPAPSPGPDTKPQCLSVRAAADAVNQLKKPPLHLLLDDLQRGLGAVRQRPGLPVVPHAGRHPLHRHHLRLVPRGKTPTWTAATSISESCA